MTEDMKRSEIKKEQAGHLQEKEATYAQHKLDQEKKILEYSTFTCAVLIFKDLEHSTQ